MNCLICNKPIKKEQTLVFLHYPVKIYKGDSVIWQSNLQLHFDCRFSPKGHEFLKKK